MPKDADGKQEKNQSPPPRRIPNNIQMVSAKHLADVASKVMELLSYETRSLKEARDVLAIVNGLIKNQQAKSNGGKGAE